jgi:hypothetical protein
MAVRDFLSQNLHDKVIQVASDQLDKTNHDVYTNPSSQHNAWIGDNYPDIILTKKGDMIPEFIIEVETADSVNITEAINQWKKYATEIKASFYLLVPLSHKNEAINLCKQIGISARFGTYKTDNSGNVININYE